MWLKFIRYATTSCQSCYFHYSGQVLIPYPVLADEQGQSLFSSFLAWTHGSTVIDPEGGVSLVSSASQCG